MRLWKEQLEKIELMQCKIWVICDDEIDDDEDFHEVEDK
jgi:hypothetical protein